MSDRQKFYFLVKIFGEVDANNREMAELIVKNGVTTSLRLQSEEADMEVLISEIKEEVGLVDEDLDTDDVDDDDDD